MNTESTVPLIFFDKWSAYPSTVFVHVVSQSKLTDFQLEQLKQLVYSWYTIGYFFGFGGWLIGDGEMLGSGDAGYTWGFDIRRMHKSEFEAALVLLSKCLASLARHYDFTIVHVLIFGELSDTWPDGVEVPKYL